MAHSLLHFTESRTETAKTIRETEAEAVAFVVWEAIGLEAKSSVDYIQLYSGNNETLLPLSNPSSARALKSLPRSHRPNRPAHGGPLGRACPPIPRGSIDVPAKFAGLRFDENARNVTKLRKSMRAKRDRVL